MKTSLTWFAILFPSIMAQPLRGSTETRLNQLPDDIGLVQRQLKPDEMMLEYVLTDSSVQINAIARESVFVTTESLGQLFWISLVSFRKQLRSAEPREFLIPGEIMYLFLVKPVQNFLTGRHRLIIIPDDRLRGIPFEAFIRSDTLPAGKSTSNLHYLVRDFEVVYHSSRSCWKESAMAGGARHPMIPGDCQFAFMGFSPEIKETDRLTPLPAAKTEIEEIGALFRQKGLSSWLVYDERSGKDYFKTMACRGRIVHLAMHCIPENPGCQAGGLVFSGYNPEPEESRVPDGLLTMDELKALQLEADLIVVNACSSGGGRIISGTFDNSLPQLLALAGARNILSTLWNVTDNLAKHFMLDFYRSWLSGKTYSEALRDVKLHWINCRTTTLPTIWAAYVLMGE